jgi:hypothetical protein
VVRDGCAPDTGLYRELGYPRDNAEGHVECLAAGCDCGSRSPRWVPQLSAEWAPFAVWASKADEQRGRQLWRRHLDLDVALPHPLRVDATATQAELVRRGELVAMDLVAADVIDLAGCRR